MLHPLEKDMGTVRYGQEIRLVVPEYEVLVLELSEAAKEPVCCEVLPALDRVLPADNDGSCRFFADERIRQLLNMGKKYVTDKSIRAEAEYCRVFHRINDCWTRPDRLWAWVCLEPMDSPCGLSLLCNGRSVKLRREQLSHNQFSLDTLFFADITDSVRWNEENTLRLSSDTGPVRSAVVYLSYLKPQNEALPESGYVLPDTGRAAPRLDPAVRVLRAELNGDNIMRPGCSNVVTAEVNLPPEQLEGVYLTAPVSIGDTGFDLKCDMAMEYSGGKWVKAFQSDERIHLIIDDCRLSVWAVTKDGAESEALDVDFTWLL